MFIRKCLNFDYNAVLKPLDCESFTNIANIKKKGKLRAQVSSSVILKDYTNSRPFSD